MYQFIIEDAAALWNAVSGSYIELALANEGDTPDVYLYLKRELKDAPFSAGYSLFSAYNDDGSPKTCEIHIAATTRSSFRGIGKTALHEFGHCLGLGHSLIPEAIMSYRLDKNDYELDIDDEAALSRLYPMDGSDPKLPPGCSVLPQRASGQVPAWVWWVALLLPLTSSFRAFGRWRPLPLQQHPREP